MLKSTKQRFEKLERKLEDQAARIDSLEFKARIDAVVREREYKEKLEAATTRHRNQFTYGTKVGWKGARAYAPRWNGYGAGPRPWRGTVIPRPFDARRYGKTGDEFVHVLTDDGQIRSCYAYNLEVV